MRLFIFSFSHFICLPNKISNVNCNHGQWKMQSVTWTKWNSFLIRFDLLAIWFLCVQANSLLSVCVWIKCWAPVTTKHEWKYGISSHEQRLGIIISCPDNELIPSAQCVCIWTSIYLHPFTASLRLFPND